MRGEEERQRLREPLLRKVKASTAPCSPAQEPRAPRVPWIRLALTVSWEGEDKEQLNKYNFPLENGPQTYHVIPFFFFKYEDNSPHLGF